MNGRCGSKVNASFSQSESNWHTHQLSCVDVPDQAAIVRQYMRYTAQIMSGKNISKMVMRALQMYVRQIPASPYLTNNSSYRPVQPVYPKALYICTLDVRCLRKMSIPVLQRYSLNCGPVSHQQGFLQTVGNLARYRPYIV